MVYALHSTHSSIQSSLGNRISFSEIESSGHLATASILGAASAVAMKLFCGSLRVRAILLISTASGFRRNIPASATTRDHTRENGAEILKEKTQVTFGIFPM